MQALTSEGNRSKGPPPSLALWVDQPKGRVLRDCECQFSAWAISARSGVFDRVVFRTSSARLDVRIVERPDVKQSYPDMNVTGFVGVLSLTDHVAAVKNGKLGIWVLSGTKVVTRFHLQIAPGVFGKAIQRAIGC